MKTRKSWREKMDTPKLPMVKPIPPSAEKRMGTGTFLVPHPRDVDAAVRTVRKGDLMTVTQIRAYLAAKFSANVTCPLATGIFLRIVAEAAEEAAREGKQRITPYWRIVKEDGSLNPNFPGGVEAQSARLREEGHQIVPGKGKRPPRVAV